MPQLILTGATRLLHGSITYRTSGRFLQQPNTAIYKKLSPVGNYRRSLESTDIWVLSRTWYLQAYWAAMEFPETSLHVIRVTYLESGDLPNIREVSLKCQNLSLGIFQELLNLMNIREVLPLVLLSHVPFCVFIFPVVLSKFVDRYATSAIVQNYKCKDETVDYENLNQTQKVLGVVNFHWSWFRKMGTTQWGNKTRTIQLDFSSE